MKVLLANCVFHPQTIGGAETATLLLARELSARGIEAHVLASTGRRGQRAPTEGWPSRRRVEGVAGFVHEAPPAGLYDLLPRGGPAGAPGTAVKALHHLLNVRSARWGRLAGRVLDEIRPDLLHSQTIVGLTPAIWLAARARGVPVVHTLHDYHLLCPRTTLLRSDGRLCESACLPCRLLAAGKRPATGAVAAVTAPSRYVLERHLAAGAFSRAAAAGLARVVPNAAPPPGTAAAASTAGGEVQGLFLGQLSPHKGIPALLRAVASLLDGPSPPAGFRFAFAGEGPLADEVEAFCARRPAAVYCGRVDGPAKEDLLRRTSFLVLPSVWPENFPLSLLEGFGRGLPAIASRRGGIPELVEDGRCGQIVEPEPAALAAAIRRYAEDPALLASHGAAARVRAGDFTVQRHLAGFLEIYEEVCRRRRTHGRSSGPASTA